MLFFSLSNIRHVIRPFLSSLLKLYRNMAIKSVALNAVTDIFLNVSSFAMINYLKKVYLAECLIANKVFASRSSMVLGCINVLKLYTSYNVRK